MKHLNESLNYMDMQHHVLPKLGIDEFQSNIGEDSDMVVLNFTVDGEDVADDLVEWLERGYDFVVDAERSPGEVLDKKFYVFVELNRRSSAAKRIIEILGDLETLTGIKVGGWTLKIDGHDYPATVDAIEENVILSSAEYNKENQGDLNEWRSIAGIPRKPIHTSYSDDVIEWQRKAKII